MAGVGVCQRLDAVDRKGEMGARRHMGVTVQAAAEAFETERLDPARYALWCRDVDEHGTERLGVQMDQLLLAGFAQMWKFRERFV